MMLSLFTKSYLGVSFFAMILVLSAYTNVNAQNGSNVVLSLNEEAIGNLKNAITADNPGLRKSGIYLAGKHSVREVSGTLLAQLEKEENPELKILIMMVLYIIDDSEFMDDIYNFAINEQNDRVR